MATLLSVNLGAKTVADWAGPSGHSGIDKRPVDHRVHVVADGVEGDQVSDRRVHGGADKAVYAYAREDATWWEAELGRPLPPGRFGENLTTEGVDLTGAVVGERWAVGSAVLEVVQPRSPCTTFAGFWGVPDLVRRFTAHGAPGTYLRVVRDGDLGAGDDIRVVHHPVHGVTIGEVFRAVHGETALLPRLLAAPELPADLRQRVARRLGVPVPSR